MKTIITALIFFNCFDAASTLFILSNEYGVELNPVMAALYSWNPAAFVGFKVVATTGAAYVFWVNRGYEVARTWAIITTAIYGTLFSYQVLSLFYLLIKGIL